MNIWAPLVNLTVILSPSRTFQHNHNGMTIDQAWISILRCCVMILERHRTHGPLALIQRISIEWFSDSRSSLKQNKRYWGATMPYTRDVGITTTKSTASRTRMEKQRKLPRRQLPSSRSSPRIQQSVYSPRAFNLVSNILTSHWNFLL